MNSTLLTSSASNFKPQTVKSSTLKAIAFKLGSLNLAVPITVVSKILKQTPIEGSGTNNIGVAHLGNRELTVIDLQRQLFRDSAIKNQGQDNHLIILKTASAGKNVDSYGIPVENVPALMDIPLSSLRVLPESYRQADTLGIASHVAVIPQEQGSMTIFLLDPDRLIASL